MSPLRSAAPGCLLRIVRGKITVVFALAVLGCSAQQQWEIGAAGGYGFYRNASIIAPSGTAEAGIRDRFALSGFIDQHMYQHLTGEFRYTFQDGDPFLESGGVKTNMQGQSHAFVYDLLVQARPREARIRPYLAGGLGAKWYRTTGPENPFQPLRSIGVLTTRNDVVPVISVGGGVSIQVHTNVRVRLDFRDYITPFPSNVITPVRFATARGMLHMFTPLLGVGFAF